jgi:hypothetical protein
MTPMQTKTNTPKPGNNPDFIPGPIRAKRCPPTIPEAVAAARDIADDIEGQVEIAAALMGVDPEAVRDEVQRAAVESRKSQDRLNSGEQVMVRDRTGGARTVTVQRTGRPARAAVVVERKRFTGLAPVTRPGTIRTFDLTRRSSRDS